MPNHVYSKLQFNAEHFTTLEAIIEEHKCLCEWLNPTPTELLERQPFNKKGDNKTLDLVEKYGYDNWYDWRVHNYGTKWGMYDVYLYNDGNTCDVHYTTAWGPLSDTVLYKLHDLFGIIQYEWEEEQGYGQAFEVNEDNEIVLTCEWDIPEFSEEIWRDENGSFVCRLEADHVTPYIECKAGEFFYDYNINEPFYGDINELKQD